MAYTDIDKSDEYFNTKLYTGNGSATHAITGVGFQPNWVWIKERSSTSSHLIFDVLRGTNKKLSSNTTEGEETFAYLSSFDSDGFTIGTSDGAINNLGDTYASWNWKANGAGVSNTAGSITSTVSANTTSGFSIVGWTGTAGVATVGHGLGVKPDVIIVKNRSVVSSWVVYHKSLGATKYLFLNLTLAQQTDSLAWNNTEPDSSKFTINNYTNGSGNNLIAYCFAEKKGFSKFGSYVGNSSTDGSFVYTGMRPAFVLLKNITAGGNDWWTFDSKRSGFNANNLGLQPSGAYAEDSTTGYLDILSNGFKMRSTNSFNNASGNTYIYMAFAENPLVTSTGIPTTAR